MDDFNKEVIKEQLVQMAEEEYRSFTSSLLPGREHILGVRLPMLRKLAARIAKDNFRKYLEQASDDSFEELMLQGMVIGLAKCGLEEKLAYAKNFIPKIDCWSICDSFCGGLKITNHHKERVWEFLQPYLHSEKEYELRFGVVMILGYYVLPEYCDRVFAHFDRIKHEGYYVKMAIAWAISVFFVKLPDQTMEYLKENSLDDFTYNKALQKIRESLRVDQETKKLLFCMRR